MNYTLVTTRRVWQSGDPARNYRETTLRFPRLEQAIAYIKTLEDDDFEALGIRQGSNWVWQS